MPRTIASDAEDPVQLPWDDASTIYSTTMIRRSLRMLLLFVEPSRRGRFGGVGIIGPFPAKEFLSLELIGGAINARACEFAGFQVRQLQ
jgi:hypothetical protein